MTCKEYGRAKCRDGNVRRACGETCGTSLRTQTFAPGSTGQCSPRKSAPVTEGCHDDPFYRTDGRKGHGFFARSAFNWHCARFQSRNCSSLAHID